MFFKLNRALLALALTTAFYFSSIPPAVYVGTGLGAIVITQTACPGGSKDGKTLKSVAEAAKDIGGGTRDVIKAVDEAYTKKLISIQQKDRLADLLLAIARGGKKGVDVIDAIQQSGLTDIPADKQQILSAIFTDEVVAPFLMLLTELGKLTETQAAAIRAALAVVRTSIVLLSSKIGRIDIPKEIERLEAIHAAVTQGAFSNGR